MKNSQKLILVNNYNNLYNLIAAFGDARAEGAESILLWAQGESSAILQEMGELEILERYARKFNLQVTLSAAGNPLLRHLATQLGWNVLWQIPGMDAILLGEAIQREANQWVVEEEEAKWQVAG